MRKVELDFERAQRPRFLGKLVLVCSTLIVAAAILWTMTLHQQNNRLATLLDSMEAHQTGTQASAANDLKPEGIRQSQQFKRAQEIIQGMAFPWQSFFDMIETARSDSIAILSLQPDTMAGTVLITAEARDLNSALAYIERLKAEPRLQRTFMVSHESLEHGPRSAVKFTVKAIWVGTAAPDSQGTFNRTAAHTDTRSEKP